MDWKRESRASAPASPRREEAAGKPLRPAIAPPQKAASAAGFKPRIVPGGDGDAPSPEDSGDKQSARRSHLRVVK